MTPVADVVHHVRAGTPSVQATYEVPSLHEPQKPSSYRPEPVREVEPEPYRAAERPQPISYVPDDLDDISEIVRHAEPAEDVPTQPTREESPVIETVSSSVNITYDADDLEVPAFMRKREQS